MSALPPYAHEISKGMKAHSEWMKKMKGAAAFLDRKDWVPQNGESSTAVPSAVDVQSGFEK